MTMRKGQENMEGRGVPFQLFKLLQGSVFAQLCHLPKSVAFFK